MPTVAVTGATGYIGSHVVRALLEADYTVHAAVRNETDEAKVGPLRKLTESASGKGKLVFFGGADLFQEGSFDQAFAGCDAVIHTAAIVEVLSQKDAQKTVVDPSYGIGAALTSSDQAFTAGGFRAACKGHRTW